MVYVGIDISKYSHEAAVLDEQGKVLKPHFAFYNSKTGFERLVNAINKIEPNPANVTLGMEATGHYYLNLYCFLLEYGFQLAVINPLQSTSFRDYHIRQCKTDAKDCVLIAEVLRFGKYSNSKLAEEKYFALKQLSRYRSSISNTISETKTQVLCLLDKVFPEYQKLFSETFGPSSFSFLSKHCIPSEIAELSIDEIYEILKKASLGRLKISKAEEIKTAAENSVGIAFAVDTFKFQIEIQLQQIKFLEESLKKLDERIKELVLQTGTKLLTLKGIGYAHAASILGEIGDINRFSSASKLVAYSGIDPSIKQSGTYTSSNSKISKRGSSYLRETMFLAAIIAEFHDPTLSAYYRKKIAEGKHHYVATLAVARKMLGIIYSMLKNDTAYNSASN